jgi:hypothetical protein
MKTRLAILTGILLSLSSGIYAQDLGAAELTEGQRGHLAAGYTFRGWDRELDMVSPIWGAGWETVFKQGPGLGVEGTVRHDRLLLSTNGSYHFSQTHRVDPFVSGGLSFGMGAGDRGIGVGETGFNVGGGVNLWAANRVGARLEFRNYTGRLQYSRTDLHEVRIAFIWR